VKSQHVTMIISHCSLYSTAFISKARRNTLQRHRSQTSHAMKRAALQSPSTICIYSVSRRQYLPRQNAPAGSSAGGRGGLAIASCLLCTPAPCLTVDDYPPA